MKLLPILRCLRALRGFTITGLVMVMCFPLAGCYYLFISGVEGSYTAKGTPLLGEVTSRDEQTGGTLEIGSAEKQQCKGRYSVSQVKTNRWRLETGERTYRGRIYCLDGRAGEFDLISADKGRTGSITGEINGEAFQLNLIEPKKSECTTDECRWGLKWTYENERRDSTTYYKVEQEHTPNLTDR
ncbi:hypothetical protein ELH99_32475 (plasmid) [Rhizobium leguminosarum]|uniref:hypothetical protein n=1 Tax=Rhizobium leguminosarum TaxID=384 RepID=UPI0010305780|nr:hypothetical protein [Rhizobium leguminosarum]QIO76653.1 hypothetical protein HA459_32405 [Rhizobium leguminosarum bv. trifolii]QIO83673.1 hypothetical protein HA460_32440 [Rhizobium leguminosarum bv. trifolii]TAX44166.1 hypothetical protein ELH99_32475 [Rhizobium leguminosarum]